MGGWAARKCLKLIENVENVLAVELLAACQGLDLRKPLTVRSFARETMPFLSPDVKFFDDSYNWYFIDYTTSSGCS
jgi:histidine ammonia-lyase